MGNLLAILSSSGDRLERFIALTMNAMGHFVGAFIEPKDILQFLTDETVKRNAEAHLHRQLLIRKRTYRRELQLYQQDSSCCQCVVCVCRAQCRESEVNEHWDILADYLKKLSADKTFQRQIKTFVEIIRGFYAMFQYELPLCCQHEDKMEMIQDNVANSLIHPLRVLIDEGQYTFCKEEPLYEGAYVPGQPRPIIESGPPLLKLEYEDEPVRLIGELVEEQEAMVGPYVDLKPLIGFPDASSLEIPSNSVSASLREESVEPVPAQLQNVSNDTPQLSPPRSQETQPIPYVGGTRTKSLQRVTHVFELEKEYTQVRPPMSPQRATNDEKPIQTSPRLSELCQSHQRQWKSPERIVHVHPLRSPAQTSLTKASLSDYSLSSFAAPEDVFAPPSMFQDISSTETQEACPQIFSEASFPEYVPLDIFNTAQAKLISTKLRETVRNVPRQSSPRSSLPHTTMLPQYPIVEENTEEVPWQLSEISSAERASSQERRVLAEQWLHARLIEDIIKAQHEVMSSRGSSQQSICKSPKHTVQIKQTPTTFIDERISEEPSSFETSAKDQITSTNLLETTYTITSVQPIAIKTHNPAVLSSTPVRTTTTDSQFNNSLGISFQKHKIHLSSDHKQLGGDQSEFSENDSTATSVMSWRAASSVKKVVDQYSAATEISTPTELTRTIYQKEKRAIKKDGKAKEVNVQREVSVPFHIQPQPRAIKKDGKAKEVNVQREVSVPFHIQPQPKLFPSRVMKGDCKQESSLQGKVSKRFGEQYGESLSDAAESLFDKPIITPDEITQKAKEFIEELPTITSEDIQRKHQEFVDMQQRIEVYHRALKVAEVYQRQLAQEGIVQIESVVKRNKQVERKLVTEDKAAAAVSHSLGHPPVASVDDHLRKRPQLQKHIVGRPAVFDVISEQTKLMDMLEKVLKGYKVTEHTFSTTPSEADSRTDVPKAQLVTTESEHNIEYEGTHQSRMDLKPVFDYTNELTAAIISIVRGLSQHMAEMHREGEDIAETQSSTLNLFRDTCLRVVNSVYCRTPGTLSANETQITHVDSQAEIIMSPRTLTESESSAGITSYQTATIHTQQQIHQRETQPVIYVKNYGVKTSSNISYLTAMDTSRSRRHSFAPHQVTKRTVQQDSEATFRSVVDLSRFEVTDDERNLITALNPNMVRCLENPVILRLRPREGNTQRIAMGEVKDGVFVFKYDYTTDYSRFERFEPPGQRALGASQLFHIPQRRIKIRNATPSTSEADDTTMPTTSSMQSTTGTIRKPMKVEKESHKKDAKSTKIATMQKHEQQKLVQSHTAQLNKDEPFLQKGSVDIEIDGEMEKNLRLFAEKAGMEPSVVLQALISAKQQVTQKTSASLKSTSEKAPAKKDAETSRVMRDDSILNLQETLKMDRPGPDISKKISISKLEDIIAQTKPPVVEIPQEHDKAYKCIPSFLLPPQGAAQQTIQPTLPSKLQQPPQPMIQQSMPHAMHQAYAPIDNTCKRKLLQQTQVSDLSLDTALQLLATQATSGLQPPSFQQPPSHQQLPYQQLPAYQQQQPIYQGQQQPIYQGQQQPIYQGQQQPIYQGQQQLMDQQQPVQPQSETYTTPIPLIYQNLLKQLSPASLIELYGAIGQSLGTVQTETNKQTPAEKMWSTTQRHIHSSMECNPISQVSAPLPQTCISSQQMELLPQPSETKKHKKDRKHKEHKEGDVSRSVQIPLSQFAPMDPRIITKSTLDKTGNIVLSSTVPAPGIIPCSSTQISNWLANTTSGIHPNTNATQGWTQPSFPDSSSIKIQTPPTHIPKVYSTSHEVKAKGSIKSTFMEPTIQQRASVGKIFQKSASTIVEQTSDTETLSQYSTVLQEENYAEISEETNGRKFTQEQLEGIPLYNRPSFEQPKGLVQSLKFERKKDAKRKHRTTCKKYEPPPISNGEDDDDHKQPQKHPESTPSRVVHTPIEKSSKFSTQDQTSQHSSQHHRKKTSNTMIVVPDLDEMGHPSMAVSEFAKEIYLSGAENMYVQLKEGSPVLYQGQACSTDIHYSPDYVQQIEKEEQDKLEYQKYIKLITLKCAENCGITMTDEEFREQFTTLTGHIYRQTDSTISEYTGSNADLTLSITQRSYNNSIVVEATTVKDNKKRSVQIQATPQQEGPFTLHSTQNEGIEPVNDLQNVPQYLVPLLYDGKQVLYAPQALPENASPDIAVPLLTPVGIIYNPLPNIESVHRIQQKVKKSSNVPAISYNFPYTQEQPVMARAIEENPGEEYVEDCCTAIESEYGSYTGTGTYMEMEESFSRPLIWERKQKIQICDIEELTEEDSGPSDVLWPPRVKGQKSVLPDVTCQPNQVTRNFGDMIPNKESNIRQPVENVNERRAQEIELIKALGEIKTDAHIKPQLVINKNESPNFRKPGLRGGAPPPPLRSRKQTAQKRSTEGRSDRLKVAETIPPTSSPGTPKAMDVSTNVLTSSGPTTAVVSLVTSDRSEESITGAKDTMERETIDPSQFESKPRLPCKKSGSTGSLPTLFGGERIFELPFPYQSAKVAPRSRPERLESTAEISKSSSENELHSNEPLGAGRIEYLTWEPTSGEFELQLQVGDASFPQKASEPSSEYKSQLKMKGSGDPSTSDKSCVSSKSEHRRARSSSPQQITQSGTTVTKFSTDSVEHNDELNIPAVHRSRSRERRGGPDLNEEELKWQMAEAIYQMRTSEVGEENRVQPPFKQDDWLSRENISAAALSWSGEERSYLSSHRDPHRLWGYRRSISEVRDPHEAEMLAEKGLLVKRLRQINLHLRTGHLKEFSSPMISEEVGALTNYLTFQEANLHREWEEFNKKYQRYPLRQSERDAPKLKRSLSVEPTVTTPQGLAEGDIYSQLTITADTLRQEWEKFSKQKDIEQVPVPADPTSSQSSTTMGSSVTKWDSVRSFIREELIALVKDEVPKHVTQLTRGQVENPTQVMLVSEQTATNEPITQETTTEEPTMTGEVPQGATMVTQGTMTSERVMIRATPGKITITGDESTRPPSTTDVTSFGDWEEPLEHSLAAQGDWEYHKNQSTLHDDDYTIRSRDYVPSGDAASASDVKPLEDDYEPCSAEGAVPKRGVRHRRRRQFLETITDSSTCSSLTEPPFMASKPTPSGDLSDIKRPTFIKTDQYYGELSDATCYEYTTTQYKEDSSRSASVTSSVTSETLMDITMTAQTEVEEEKMLDETLVTQIEEELSQTIALQRSRQPKRPSMQPKLVSSSEIETVKEKVSDLTLITQTEEELSESVTHRKPRLSKRPLLKESVTSSQTESDKSDGEDRSVIEPERHVIWSNVKKHETAVMHKRVDSGPLKTMDHKSLMHKHAPKAPEKLKQEVQTHKQYAARQFSSDSIDTRPLKKPQKPNREAQETERHDKRSHKKELPPLPTERREQKVDRPTTSQKLKREAQVSERHARRLSLQHHKEVQSSSPTDSEGTELMMHAIPQKLKQDTQVKGIHHPKKERSLSSSESGATEPKIHRPRTPQKLTQEMHVIQHHKKRVHQPIKESSLSPTESVDTESKVQAHTTPQKLKQEVQKVERHTKRIHHPKKQRSPSPTQSVSTESEVYVPAAPQKLKQQAQIAEHHIRRAHHPKKEHSQSSTEDIDTETHQKLKPEAYTAKHQVKGIHRLKQERSPSSTESVGTEPKMHRPATPYKSKQEAHVAERHIKRVYHPKQERFPSPTGSVETEPKMHRPATAQKLKLEVHDAKRHVKGVQHPRKESSPSSTESIDTEPKMHRPATLQKFKPEAYVAKHEVKWVHHPKQEHSPSSTESADMEPMMHRPATSQKLKAEAYIAKHQVKGVHHPKQEHSQSSTGSVGTIPKMHRPATPYKSKQEAHVAERHVGRIYLFKKERCVSPTKSVDTEPKMYRSAASHKLKQETDTAQRHHPKKECSLSPTDSIDTKLKMCRPATIHKLKQEADITVEHRVKRAQYLKKQRSLSPTESLDTEPKMHRPSTPHKLTQEAYIAERHVKRVHHPKKGRSLLPTESVYTELEVHTPATPHKLKQEAHVGEHHVKKIHHHKEEVYLSPSDTADTHPKKDWPKIAQKPKQETKLSPPSATTDTVDTDDLTNRSPIHKETKSPSQKHIGKKPATPVKERKQEVKRHSVPLFTQKDRTKRQLVDFESSFSQSEVDSSEMASPVSSAMLTTVDTENLGSTVTSLHPMSAYEQEYQYIEKPFEVWDKKTKTLKPIPYGLIRTRETTPKVPSLASTSRTPSEKMEQEDTGKESVEPHIFSPSSQKPQPKEDEQIVPIPDPKTPAFAETQHLEIKADQRFPQKVTQKPLQQVKPSASSQYTAENPNIPGTLAHGGLHVEERPIETEIGHDARLTHPYLYQGASPILSPVATCNKDPEIEEYYLQQIDKLPPDLAKTSRMILQLNPTLSAKDMFGITISRRFTTRMQLVEFVTRAFPPDINLGSLRLTHSLLRTPKRSERQHRIEEAVCKEQTKQQQTFHQKVVEKLESGEASGSDASKSGKSHERYVEQLVPPHQVPLRIPTDVSTEHVLLWPPKKKKHMPPPDSLKKN